MNASSKIKWGIVGCGNIAHKFCEDLSLIKHAVLYAVASRDIEKAMDFAHKHQALKSYGSYMELFKDPEIDIVYIATPHTFHYELSIQAMKHDKHVLCEKPMAMNYREVAKMVEVSKKKNVFLMEALWTRFNPNFIAIKQHIDNGDIGDVTYINADFSFITNKPLHSRLFAMELGGGALLDIGIYPVFLSYLVLGLPKTIKATSKFHQITGCDLQTSMIFDYERAQSVLHCGFSANSDMIAKIYGTEGAIHIHSTWHMTEGYTLISKDEEKVFHNKTLGHSYTYEIDACHRSIRQKHFENELWSHKNSLELISILDKVRRQIALVYPQDAC